MCKRRSAAYDVGLAPKAICLGVADAYGDIVEHRKAKIAFINKATQILKVFCTSVPITKEIGSRRLIQFFSLPIWRRRRLLDVR